MDETPNIQIQEAHTLKKKFYWRPFAPTIDESRFTATSCGAAFLFGKSPFPWCEVICCGTFGRPIRAERAVDDADDASCCS